MVEICAHITDSDVLYAPSRCHILYARRACGGMRTPVPVDVSVVEVDTFLVDDGDEIATVGGLCGGAGVPRTLFVYAVGDKVTPFCVAILIRFLCTINAQCASFAASIPPYPSIQVSGWVIAGVRREEEGNTTHSGSRPRLVVFPSSPSFLSPS